jgi:hypothetical protein
MMAAVGGLQRKVFTDENNPLLKQFVQHFFEQNPKLSRCRYRCHLNQLTHRVYFDVYELPITFCMFHCNCGEWCGLESTTSLKIFRDPHPTKRKRKFGPNLWETRGKVPMDKKDCVCGIHWHFHKDSGQLYAHFSYSVLEN